MLQVRNRTPFKAALGVFANPDGIDCAYAVVKATFQLGPGPLKPAAEQAPLIPIDAPHGDPLQTSLKAAGEITLSKPSTDVLLIGSAYPREESLTQTDVRLKVGPLEKVARVFGDRIWERGVFGLQPSAPKAFEKIPLLFERAFGGTDAEPYDPQRVDYEPRNPVGCGMAPKNSGKKVEGSPLPNVEDPKQLLKLPFDRPAPVGFGPVAPHWSPRKEYAGTYDEAWIKKRAPFLPKDFNPRFLQVAPTDQIAPEYLKGGEPVELHGVSPRGPLKFELPRCQFEFIFDFDGQKKPQVPVLDTVVLRPDDNVVWMIWRACFVVDKKLLRLKELEVRCLEFF